MKNVLLLCLSPVREGAPLSLYNYATRSGENIAFSGYATNEAPAKCVIDSIRRTRKRGKDRLDKVVCVCSARAVSPIAPEGTRIGDIPISPEMTHLDFFRQQVDTFAREVDPIYESRPICYSRILVDDYTGSNQISLAATAAAEEILELSDSGDIRLYIDYNGGQRYFSLMLLAISSLIQRRGVKLAKVLSMNYENRIDGKVQIQNLAPIFGCMDLVSAISEYVNFGRTRTLEQYFKPCLSRAPDIASLLTELKHFAQDLLLCRSADLEARKEPLHRQLLAFLAGENVPASDDEDLNAYRTLFSFVVKDIYEEMSALLTGTLPDMMIWCIGHDYIQQALTFYTELLPGYLWQTGMLAPTPGEAEEYRAFRQARQTLCADYAYIDELRLIPAAYQENSPAYCYCWLIQYLSRTVSNRPAHFQELLTDCRLPGDRAADFGTVRAGLSLDLAILGSMQAMGFRPGDEACRLAINNAARILAQIYTGAADRVQTNLPKDAISQILTIYFLIKDQRNATNHAGEAAVKWSFEDYGRHLTDFADRLKALT